MLQLLIQLIQSASFNFSIQFHEVVNLVALLTDELHGYGRVSGFTVGDIDRGSVESTDFVGYLGVRYNRSVDAPKGPVRFHHPGNPRWNPDDLRTDHVVTKDTLANLRFAVPMN